MTALANPRWLTPNLHIKSFYEIYILIEFNYCGNYGSNTYLQIQCMHYNHGNELKSKMAAPMFAYSLIQVIWMNVELLIG